MTTTQPALRRFSAAFRSRNADNNTAESLALEDQIRQAISGVSFGTVTIVVQDGVVVQLERNEKIRPSKQAG